MEEKEIWKDIEGYEGMYQVSNMGNVKSLNYNHTGKEKILKVKKDRSGYLRVHFYKGAENKWYLVHRLVATAFLENPEGYKEINHINEIKSDNRAENLEFCSRLYNLTYNGRAEKIGEKLKGRKFSEEHKKKIAEKKNKPVFSVDKESGLIMWWKSAKEAERCTGIAKQSICNCLKGRQKSAGGFYWYYADTE